MLTSLNAFEKNMVMRVKLGFFFVAAGCDLALKVQLGLGVGLHGIALPFGQLSDK